MQKNLLFFLCALCTITTRGQVIIEGKVLSNQKPVSSAAAILHRLSDSAIVKTEVTDNAGNFKMAAPSAGPFFIEVTAAGYNTEYMQVPVPTPSSLQIVLEENHMLSAAGINDPFRTGTYRARNLYNGTLRNSYYDHRNVALSLTWKFGNRNVKERRRRNTDTEETNRAK